MYDCGDGLFCWGVLARPASPPHARYVRDLGTIEGDVAALISKKPLDLAKELWLTLGHYHPEQSQTARQ
jgi:hypothetical protein